MPALSLQEAADELRHRATRLRLEMDLGHDFSSADGQSSPVWVILAFAMLDAARDEWEKHGEKFPEIRDLAKKLASAEHGEIDAVVGAFPGQPPCIAKVPRLYRNPDNDQRLGDVIAVGYNLAGIRPIWAHYLQEARLMLADD